MINLNITVDIKEATKTLGILPRTARRTAALAMNRAMKSGGALLQQRIGGTKGRYLIRKSDLKAIAITRKANQTDLLAEIKARGRRIPLIKFQVKPQTRRQPVKVRLLRGGSRKPMRRAFVADLKYGRNVFIRYGAGRGKLHAVYGPSIPHMMNVNKIRIPFKRRVAIRLNQEFNRALRFAVGKGRLR